MDDGAINRVECAIPVLYRAIKKKGRAINKINRAINQLNGAIIILFQNKAPCTRGVFIFAKKCMLSS